jgi:hypothetical protein
MEQLTILQHFRMLSMLPVPVGWCMFLLVSLHSSRTPLCIFPVESLYKAPIALFHLMEVDLNLMLAQFCCLQEGEGRRMDVS